LRTLARAASSSPVTVAALIFCVSALSLLVIDVGVKIASWGEAGYGDGYVLYDVQRYLRTGFAYRDLSAPPYTPSIYGPLTYRLMALPDRMYVFQNPLLGPRLAVFLSFLACVGLCASIARALTGTWRGGAWGAALALSFVVMGNWVLLLRGDFPAILCGLAAVRLLLSGRFGPIVVAGAMAGTALLFKQTYVAVLVAGALWLILQRRWRDVAAFAGAGAVTGGSGYLFFALLEPYMLENFRALQPVLPHPRGVIRLGARSVAEPVFLLAVAAALVTGRSMTSRLGLVALSAAISGAVATVAAVQVGANVNYYFEMLLLSAPVAAWGLLTYARADSTHARFYATLLCGVLVLSLAIPNLARARDVAVLGIAGGRIASANQSWRALEDALEGRDVLALVPRVAAMQEAPIMTEPFFHAMQRQAGKIDAFDLAGRIRRTEYEAIVTTFGPDQFRIVQFPSPPLIEAIDQAYRRSCSMLGMSVHVPLDSSGSSGLADALARAGCQPEGAER
jgi:hypothetical protein